MGRALVAVKNSSASVATLFITNALSLVYRTVVVRVLGVEYAGISGLCLNVIQLFALSELGIGWAISFYLYKPLKESNYRQIAEIVYYLRKLYKFVGCFILFAGLFVLPFLNDIIKGGGDIPHLWLIFSLFLLNTSCSYLFFSYYQLLANADRKNYIMFAPQTWGNIILVSLQIAAVYFLHSFILAVAISVFSTITINYIIRRKIIRLYPFLEEHKDASIEGGLKKEIVRYIKATMLYKLSSTVLTSSTGVLISYFIGLVGLGLYSNYILIVDTIRSLVLSLINPTTSVIGELATNANTEEKQWAYDRFNFLMIWICYFCAISLFCLITPFVTLWLGNKLTLPTTTVLIITGYFYVEFIISFSTKFRDGCGLNNIGKFRPLITAILNIVLCIVLVHPLGLNGIILSLMLSRMLTLTWFEPWIVYHYVLKKNVWPYYIRMVLNAIFMLTVLWGMKWLVDCIWNDSWGSFIIAMFCCLIIPNIIFIAVYGRTQEFKYYLIKLRSVVNKHRYVDER